MQRASRRVFVIIDIRRVVLNVCIHYSYYTLAFSLDLPWRVARRDAPIHKIKCINCLILWQWARRVNATPLGFIKKNRWRRSRFLKKKENYNFNTDVIVYCRDTLFKIPGFRVQIISLGNTVDEATTGRHDSYIKSFDFSVFCFFTTLWWPGPSQTSSPLGLDESRARSFGRSPSLMDGGEREAFPPFELLSPLSEITLLCGCGCKPRRRLWINITGIDRLIRRPTPLRPT